MEKTLRKGLAGLKKKTTDKSKVTEVDAKAIKTAEFIEQVDMFDSKWNRFEDARGWIWVQEESNELSK